MGDLHHLSSILKDNAASLNERKRAVAELLETLFYSEERVVLTLLLSGLA